MYVNLTNCGYKFLEEKYNLKHPFSFKQTNTDKIIKVAKKKT